MPGHIVQATAWKWNANDDAMLLLGTVLCVYTPRLFFCQPHTRLLAYTATHVGRRRSRGLSWYRRRQSTHFVPRCRYGFGSFDRMIADSRLNLVGKLPTYGRRHTARLYLEQRVKSLIKSNKNFERGRKLAQRRQSGGCKQHVHDDDFHGHVLRALIQNKKNKKKCAHLDADAKVRGGVYTCGYSLDRTAPRCSPNFTCTFFCRRLRTGVPCTKQWQVRF